jgi:hypothetical protein
VRIGAVLAYAAVRAVRFSSFGQGLPVIRAGSPGIGVMSPGIGFPADDLFAASASGFPATAVIGDIWVVVGDIGHAVSGGLSSGEAAVAS